MNLRTAIHEAAASVNRKCQAGIAFLLLRRRSSACARDAAAVQAARVLRTVSDALTEALVSCDFVTVEAKKPDVYDCFISP